MNDPPSMYVRRSVSTVTFHLGPPDGATRAQWIWMFPRSRVPVRYSGQFGSPGVIGMNVNESDDPGSPQSVTTTLNSQVPLSLFLLKVPSRVASLPEPLGVGQAVGVTATNVSATLWYAAFGGEWRLYSNWPFPGCALNPKLTQGPPVVSWPPPVTLHLARLPAWQMPSWQVSLWVHATPSSQDVPSSAGSQLSCSAPLTQEVTPVPPQLPWPHVVLRGT